MTDHTGMLHGHVYCCPSCNKELDAVSTTPHTGTIGTEVCLSYDISFECSECSDILAITINVPHLPHTTWDECWGCGKGLHEGGDDFVEIQLGGRSQQVLHRACLKCASVLPGVNIDNINAILGIDG